ncbi:glycosyltransferase family 2 protein [Limosilactobacillus balticus]|uniref:Glycosyltransferase family 2 protein n=1 Tax=Limosilactobacillus balticus TaxID=2759747 RepID=A0ABS8R9U0_9LACO|nr:glycosyltransferase family 2 protein [Limosilactobacillus balticus]MBB1127539.1 glycosyltransferase family 2 protein [Limosilactobacillus balticus]MCD7137685.1 glycosyltransferase family 2 protein [Limosilactobacillus balticus]
MPDVTVIVPVYNAEQYILFLMRDLENQTYKNVEFILVNDGSKDNSLEIMENYIAKNGNDRFKIISQPNSGVSSARNKGLEYSNGKYIIFVDCDDRLSSLFVEKYVNRIESNSSDIEVFSAIKVNDRKKFIEDGRIDYSPIASMNSMDVKSYIKYFSNLQAWGYPFCYIFKRELWKNIKFNPDIKYQEDVLAFFEVLTKYPHIKIGVNKDAYYYYVSRKDSALHTMTSENAWQFVEVDDSILKLVSGQPSLKECYDFLLALKMSSLMIVIVTSCLENNDYYYQKAREQFINLNKHSKYISLKIKLRRKLQETVIRLNLKLIIKKLYARL